MQAYINLNGEEKLHREFEPELVSCVVYSVLKAGTHLVGKLLLIFGMSQQQTIRERFKGFPRKNVWFSAGHRFFNQGNAAELSTSGMKGIYIERNREDTIESIAESNDPKAWAHIGIVAHDVLGRKERVRLATSHVDMVVPLIEGWAAHPHVYTTSFERLVGNKGGGDDTAQREEIKNIYNHLNDVFISYCQEHIYGDTRTFRKGQIGEGKRNGINEKS